MLSAQSKFTLLPIFSYPHGLVWCKSRPGLDAVEPSNSRFSLSFSFWNCTLYDLLATIPLLPCLWDYFRKRYINLHNFTYLLTWTTFLAMTFLWRTRYGLMIFLTFCGRFRFWRSWVNDPSSDVYYRWLAVISIAVLYNLLFLIARTVYEQLQERCVPFWLVFDYTCDIVYAMDTFVHIRTGELCLLWAFLTLVRLLASFHLTVSVIEKWRTLISISGNSAFVKFMMS